jgi:hypothetical protein
MATIYRKTAKGHSEIETCAARLPPRLRSALILIDGRRTDGEMGKLILQAARRNPAHPRLRGRPSAKTVNMGTLELINHIYGHLDTHLTQQSLTSFGARA